MSSGSYVPYSCKIVRRVFFLFVLQNNLPRTVGKKNFKMFLHSVLINNKAEKKQYKSVVHSYAHKSISEYIRKMNTAK